MNEDFKNMARKELVEDIKKPRQGIRACRDSQGHDLCRLHPDMWNLLPERYDPEISVPDQPEFMEGWVWFRRLPDEQLPEAPRTNERFIKKIMYF